MLALEKWGQGRWEPLVMFAQTVAVSSASTYDLCVAGRKPEFRNKLVRLEDKRKWIGNYRKQGVLLMPDPEFARDFFTAVHGKKQGETVGDAMDSAYEWLEMSDRQRKRVSKNVEKKLRDEKVTWADFLDAVDKADKTNKKEYRKHIKELETEIKDIGPVKPKLSNLLTQSQAMRFFLLVTIPCWIEHGISPKQLFEQAQTGDFDAMRKLLSIDPHCTEDTKLARQRIRLLENSNDVRRRMLGSATALEPLQKLTPIQVKFLLAAYVYKICETFDAKGLVLQKWIWKREITWIQARRFPLSYPKLRSLFNAAHADTHGGREDDPDFAEFEPDAFRKRVYRHQSFWTDFN